MISNLLEELSRSAVGRRSPTAVAVLPIGATEQHGPHLPLGTDSFLVSDFARRSAEGLSDTVDAIVTPTLSIGFSPHHKSIGPTLTLGAATAQTLLDDVCASLVHSGFRKVFILNGHGGNAELVTLAARTLVASFGVEAAAGTYWTMAWEDLVAAGVHPGGHAGVFETSLMLALRPDLVGDLPSRPGVTDVASIGARPSYYRESPSTWTRIDGYTDDPSLATRDRGAVYADAIAATVTNALRSMAIDQ